MKKIFLVICFLVNIQAFTQEAVFEETDILVPPSLGANDWLGGGGVSISGDYCIMTAMKDDDAASDAGAAYIYKRNSKGEMILQKKLINPDPVTSGAFGIDADIDGNYAIVGVSRPAASNKIAYLFYKDQGGIDNWGLVKAFTFPSTTSTYSTSVEMRDGYAIIASPNVNGLRGIARIYKKDEGGLGNYGFIKELTTSVPLISNDKFGWSLTLGNEYLAVGLSGRLMTFIYQKDAGGTDNWGEVGMINDAARTNFASATYDDYIAMSWSFSTSRIRIYKKDEGGTNNWGLLKTITEQNAGSSIALEKDILVAGNNFDGFIFKKDEGGPENWGVYQQFSPSHVQSQAYGVSAATNGEDWILFGARYTNIAGTNAGAVYVYQPACYEVGIDIPEIEVTCTDPTFCLPVNINSDIPSGLFGLDFSLMYDPAVMTPTGNATLGEVSTPYATYNLNTANPGIIYGTIFLNAAPLGTYLTGQGNIICVEFTLNDGVASGTTTSLQMGDVEAGSFTPQEYCGAESATITVVDEKLEGTINFMGTNTPLAYDENTPLAYNETVVYGSDMNCTLNAANFVNTDLNGGFEYDLSNGDHISIRRDILGDYNTFINDPLSCSDVMGVINSADYNMAAQISNYSIPGDIYQLLAADVNMDGVINSLDAALISYRTVNSPLTYCEYPQENYTFDGSQFVPNSDYIPSRDWLFVDASTLGTAPYTAATRNSVPHVSSCLPVNYSDLGGCFDIAPETYAAILLGDIDGSWLGSGEEAVLKTTGTDDAVLFNLDKSILTETNIYKIPVSILDNNDIIGLDFICDYDETKISILDVELVNDAHGIQWNDQSESKLYVSIYDLEGTNEKEIIAYITIETEEVISKTLFETITTVYVNGDKSTPQYELKITSYAEELFSGISIAPNPTKNNITINTTSTEKVLGYTLSSVDGHMLENGALINDVISLGAYPTGLYFLTLNISGNTKTFKIVKN